MPDRPEHIEDALIHLHTGQWFGWLDSKNKVYSNLEIYPNHDGSSTHPKPKEADLESKLAAIQVEWDADNAPYRLERKQAYPSIEDQLDMQYRDGVDSTTTWADAIAAVKTKYPKP